MGDIFGFVKNIFKPAVDLVDNLTTSDDERLARRNQLAEIENNVKMKMLDMEAKAMDLQSELLKAQTSIINTEANSQSWLARNWRPISMISFLVIVLCDSFGIAKLDSDRVESVYELIKIGLGGYVIGRTAEKVIPKSKWGK